MKKIPPSDLIPMDIFVGNEPIQIDLIYAQKNYSRNIFGTAIYHDKAQLWAHKDIAAITLLAARRLNKDHGYILEIQDCLRTIDAQEALENTPLVKANPAWSTGERRLLAPPGKGAHPRAMAIDVRVLDDSDTEIDMGTTVDFLSEESARDYTGFSKKILNNRQILEEAFVEAADKLGFPFLPLPAEWWDFRFHPDYAYEYEPLSDSDLPPQMQMTNKIDNNIPDLSQEHFDKLASTILNVVDENF